MRRISIRPLKVKDLDNYYELQRSERLHHSYDGPYYDDVDNKDLLKRIETMRTTLEAGNAVWQSRRVIADATSDEYLGEVSWYWKSKETDWLEVGLTICDENHWGMGLGEEALREWINIVLDDQPHIVRIGLSTWSGNIGMMKLAEKLGLHQEACYRKARIVDGEYYDSVSYGILREEWEELGKKY